MKYFILTSQKTCTHLPQSENQMMCKDLSEALRSRQAFFQLPEQLVIPVSTIEQTVWADVLVSPIFMISKEIQNVIKIYGDVIYSKDVILLDQKNTRSKIYCIPWFERGRGEKIYEETDRKELVKIALELDSKINKWSNIFQVESESELDTIINLDLAESILRRSLDGVGLKETVISGIDF